MHPPTYEIFTMISKVSYQTVNLSFHQKFDDCLRWSGGFALLWSPDVFWEAARDVALLCLHRVSWGDDDAGDDGGGDDGGGGDDAGDDDGVARS